MEFFRNIGSNYKESVLKNEGIIEEMESAFKFLSYMIAGRFEKSELWSELANVASNLLRHAHVEILKSRCPSNTVDQNASEQQQIIRWLKIISQVQVFFELGSFHLSGEKVKWFVIFIIEVIKAVLKIILVMKYKKKIVLHPDIEDSSTTAADEDIKDGQNEKIPPGKIMLKRSGRLLKPLLTNGYHNHQILKTDASSSSAASSSSMQSNGECVIEDNDAELDYMSLHGEVIHIMRPLIHLSTMYLFGTKSWKPFFLSFVTDITSLKIIEKKSYAFNKKEKREIAHRKLALLFYLLRSPFFDQITKKRILGLLRACSDNIPLVGIILKPLMDYIPQWQKVYFYTWSQ